MLASVLGGCAPSHAAQSQMSRLIPHQWLGSSCFLTTLVLSHDSSRVLTDWRSVFLNLNFITSLFFLFSKLCSHCICGYRTHFTSTPSWVPQIWGQLDNRDFFFPKTTFKSARHFGSIKLAKVHTRTAYSHTHARKGLVGQQKHSSVFIYGCSLLGPREADTVGGGNSPGNQPSNNHRENWLIAKHHTC